MLAAASRGRGELGRAFAALQQLRWTAAEAASTAAAPSTSSSSTSSSSVAGTARAAAPAAARSAPPPPAAAAAAAGMAVLGVHTLDGLPMPHFAVANVRERRAPAALPEALAEVKKLAHANFDESVELAVKLGIDPRRGDQMVRGTAVLPHGTGRSVRVAVFAKEDAAEAARAAGAEVVGGEELVAQIFESGGAGLKFDKCLATPDMMPKLGKIARILGPRGLMPNPKLGTVTNNVAEAVGLMKRGRVEFRADKGGVVHGGLGKCSFGEEALLNNIGVFAAALLAARPKGVKGSGSSGYILSATISSTMGPGIPVTIPSLVSAAQTAKKHD